MQIDNSNTYIVDSSLFGWVQKGTVVVVVIIW